MAYSIYIEVPQHERIKPKRGEYPPEAWQRLAKIERALLNADPSLQLERDDALLEGEGEQLGAVLIDPNRVTLQWRSDTSYSSLLNATHAALAVLEPLGLVGFDPQVGGAIHYKADGPSFLRQFRSQLLCPDHEFELWIHDIEPPSWKRRRELRPAFDASYRLENFPPIHDLFGGDGQPSQECLAAALRRVAAYNDAIIDRLELREALELFKHVNGKPRRRADGSEIPWDLWLCRSSLEQEMGVLVRLQNLGWPAAIHAQPQWLRVTLGDATGESSEDVVTAFEPVVRAIWKAACDSGLVAHISGGSSAGSSSVEMETKDAVALLQALRHPLMQASGLAPRIEMRCGGPGTPVGSVDLQGQ